MIRHIELIKLSEVVDGKFRAEQLEELTSTIEGIVANTAGVVAHELHTRSNTLDPLDADLMLSIDFESSDAVDDYELDVDRLAVYIEISEKAVSMLVYDYEI